MSRLRSFVAPVAPYGSSPVAVSFWDNGFETIPEEVSKLSKLKVLNVVENKKNAPPELNERMVAAAIMPKRYPIQLHRACHKVPKEEKNLGLRERLL